MPPSQRGIVSAVMRGLSALGGRRRLTLVPTPDGVMVHPTSALPALEPTLALVEHRLPIPDVVLAPMPAPTPDVSATRAAGGDGRVSNPAHRVLIARTAAEHAMALLCRLQSDAETVGVVEYDIVHDVYVDMLIELGWDARPWQRVSPELRKLTGGRKRYVNRRGGKVLVFDIPDPAADEAAEIAEHFASRLPARERPALREAA